MWLVTSTAWRSAFVSATLEAEGVASFAASFDEVLATLADRAARSAGS